MSARQFAARSQVLSQKLRSKITSLSARRLHSIPHRSSNLCLRNPPLVVHNKIHRRTFLTGRRLRNLEAEANKAPASSSSQAAYLRELNKVRPDEVCRRVDSGAFASNDAVVKEYLKALVATGRIDQANLASLSNGGSGNPYHQTNMAGYNAGGFGQAAQQSTHNFGNGGMGGMGGMSGMGGMGNAGTAAPVMVKLVEPDAKSQFGRFVRGLIPITLLLGGTYYIMSQNMPGMGGKSGGGKGGGMFGMMAAHELKAQTSDKTFEDVKGCDEAKAELQEIAGTCWVFDFFL